jgi:pilus assembly protein Flp/PilA
MNGLIAYGKTWLELKTDERGVTMLEYGLLAALIAVVCVTAVTGLGTELSNIFTTIKGDITPAAG